ncbi:MarR family winged helix-turn-helix transcriptional regulator [Fictibacillus fluitans]|uniref:Winged helix DNA-binding protein n=1 Tax=Fictibacillus fluitans TaxID=3058422 RepID=A0ABT8HTD8_9BACL|nr:winged helix DNA-binding protein [Fictibacillus sp. NE201]MDN4524021.1 winged helix DNA-binding protein [Fictibacillus sp. NE201]
MNSKERLLQAKRKSEEISAVFLKEYQELMEEYELTSKQLNLLQFIQRNKQTTMNDIARFLNASASAASQAIRKLEGEGYLMREVNVSNRRETFVSLGEKGRTLLSDTEKADVRIIEKYYMQLPEKEIEAYCCFVEQMHRLVNGVEESE